jgi:hypothetical protein
MGAFLVFEFIVSVLSLIIGILWGIETKWSENFIGEESMDYTGFSFSEFSRVTKKTFLWSHILTVIMILIGYLINGVMEFVIYLGGI